MGRQRRSAEQVRAEILRAAGEVFAERGFSGASTRVIAERAGVAEVLIFRHFGTKAALYGAAAFAGFASFVTAFIAGFETSGAPGENEEIDSANGYMGGLFDELRANKPMIRMLLASSTVDPELDDASLSANAILQEAFARLEALVEEIYEARGWRVGDVALAVRCIFGMALSMAVMDDLVLPLGDDGPSRDDIVREMALYLHHGIWGRPAWVGADAPTTGTRRSRRR
jgi:AcrR family transcriptional regulator